MTHIFKPTRKVVESYRHDLRSALDLITAIVEDAGHRQRLGLTEDEHYRLITQNNFYPTWEPWQSQLADLLGSLRVVTGNLEYLTKDELSSPLTRLARKPIPKDEDVA